MMNLNAATAWSGGSLQQVQLLIIMIVVLACLIVLPCGLVVYNIYRFNKTKFEKSHITKWLVALMLTFFGIGLVFNILALIFYFGASIMPNNPEQARTLVSVFIVLAVVPAIFNYVVLFAFNNYVMIGINDEIINVFGEIYKTEKVVSVVYDKDGKTISAHIAVGKRVVKRVKYKITSMCGQCLQLSAGILKHEVVEGNNKEIYLREVQERQLAYQNEVMKNAQRVGQSKTSRASASASSASRASKASDSKKEDGASAASSASASPDEPKSAKE